MLPLILALVTAISIAIPAPASAQPAGRPRIGVALGGGSARGLAHVGVLRWLEEHRIPIDVVTGTSMGGLIGGSYATGMTPDEIETMLSSIDWDRLFGSSRFEFVNVRRKRDLRAYPSRLEFGLKGGIVPPSSLNTGQQVDLLLSRIAAAYYNIATFDELPTPFRCVAVDLRRAETVVMSDGSLASAMRATMSLPLVFPPVTAGDRVLVDGGAMNNIPVDAARAMSADKVIAVNVGDLSAKALLDYSLIGLARETLDAMMRANTLRGTAGADVLIHVPLSGYGSLDWRRAAELIKEGYAAADRLKAELMPLAIDDAAWQAWRAARFARRRSALPQPAFVEIQGAAQGDSDRMRTALAVHVGVPFDVTAVETTLSDLGGLDRYETLSWQLVPNGSDHGLRVTAIPKSYGPPFVFLGLSLENTTGNEFRFGLGGRYLAFDVLGSGAELRLDLAVGSDPSLAVAWYRPIVGPFFIEPFAGVGSHTFSVIGDGHVTASYKRSRVGAGATAGINIGRLDEVRAGISYGWTAASVRIGDPGLPQLDGEDATAHLQWVHDGQDDPVVPSEGLHVQTTARRYVKAPALLAPIGEARTSEGVNQAEVSVSWLHSLDRQKRRRIFAGGNAGSSFDGKPLPTEQFSLGGPLRMSAFSVGESRGDHVAFGAAGYLHQFMRLPDFLGGRVFAGAWIETGAAFNRRSEAEIDTHSSVGAIADTLLGPMFAGVSVGMDGDSRFYVGIGRIFR